MENPTLLDLLNAFRKSIVGELHTSMPGKIVKYDPTTKLADVQPMIKRAYFDDDGVKQYESFPTIPRVPVLMPGGQGYLVTIPLGAGDMVWLSFSEGAIAEYLSTLQESEPQDLRRHSLSYPVAFPVVVPSKSAPEGDPDVTANDRMVLGKDNSNTQIQIKDDPTAPTIKIFADASDAPALASKVDAVLSAISGWTPVANDGGAALKTALTGKLGSTASTFVKIK